MTVGLATYLCFTFKENKQKNITVWLRGGGSGMRIGSYARATVLLLHVMYLLGGRLGYLLYNQTVWWSKYISK